MKRSIFSFAPKLGSLCLLACLFLGASKPITLAEYEKLRMKSFTINHLADYMRKNGQLKMAMAQYQLSLDTNPYQYALNIVYGRYVAVCENNPKKALHYFEQSLLRSPLDRHQNDIEDPLRYLSPETRLQEALRNKKVIQDRFCPTSRSHH